MFIEYNPNPDNAKRVGDCTVRAISKALNVSWDTAYLLIVISGFFVKDMPSSNSVWGDVLYQYGFRRYNLPNDCPNCYTIKDFCKTHTNGVYVLGTGSHVVTAINGNYYDAWDSGREIVSYVWRKE